MRSLLSSHPSLLVLLFLAGLSQAAAPLRAASPEGKTAPLIPLRVLFEEPKWASPRISPDGGRLAYLAPHQGVLNVWVRSLGKKDDHPITAEKGRGIRSFFWSPDSRAVFYLQDQGGNENNHLFRVDLDRAGASDLTPFHDVKVHLQADDPSHPRSILLSLNRRDAKLFDVYDLSLAEKRLRLLAENPGNVLEWEEDHQYAIRARLAMLPGARQEVSVRRTVDAPWKAVASWGPDESGGLVGFSPDDRSLWILSTVGANAERLLEIDPESGKQTVLAEDPQYDVAAVLTHPKTYRLEAVGFEREKLEWRFFDPQVRDAFDYLQSQHPGEVTIVSRDFADTTWAVSYSSDIDPASFYLFRPREKHLDFLFASRPELASYRLAPMEPISFPARDGLLLHGYLTLPLGAAGRVPFVLLVHGGPWARDSWGFSPLVQLLANRGYGVLQVNFRGSTGYGKEFVNAGDREWGGKMQTDLVDAKRWAVAHGFADPEKVAIMGMSYGGYATLAALAFVPGEFACGVEAMGPSNLLTLSRSIPPYWEPMRALFEKRLGSPGKDEAFLRERSPLFAAERIRAPLLIAQGVNDVRVKQAESDQIVEAMRKHGLAVEYLLFPDEGHGFVRPEDRLQFYRATEKFLAKRLGGRVDEGAETQQAVR
ncbi:MAG: S9 family peptidase [Methylacidiphilaceae bacterium]|nr:S9 family peptidase [Candidatus Methylacidiphilaceae bacterium]